jgi:hypothetical protein
VFETSGKTNRVFENLSGFKTSLGDHTPSFEKTLEDYFNRNSEALIEEWGLLTNSDIDQYQRKLEYLSYEVGRLYVEKDAMKNRVVSIEKAISELEKKK